MLVGFGVTDGCDSTEVEGTVSLEGLGDAFWILSGSTALEGVDEGSTGTCAFFVVSWGFRDVKGTDWAGLDSGDLVSVDT